MSDTGVARALLRGDLVRVGRDRYTAPGVVPARERLIAVPGTRTALSHGAAARAWGLPCDDPSSHVSVPHGARRRALPADVVVHQSRSWRAHVRDGVALTTLDQTLADVAMTAPIRTSLPVLDAGLRAGASPVAVERAIGARAPGRRRALCALRLADPRAESPLESLLRLLLVEAGLPPDDVQHEVRETGRFVARVDLWYEGVIVEADGFEFHASRADYRRDRRKGQAFARLGLLVLRFSWEDVVHHPDAVVATVRRTLARAAACRVGAAAEHIRVPLVAPC